MEGYLEKIASMTILELCEEWDKVMGDLKAIYEKQEQKGKSSKRVKIVESGGRRFA